MTSKKKKVTAKSEASQVEVFVEACKKAFRESGARITQPRLLVIDSLAHSQNPLTAREIYQIISKNKRVANVDQVSVYRILEALSNLGLVHQVFPSGGYLACFHSQCRSMIHVLTRCSSCEQIEEIDVPQEAFAPMLRYLKKEQDFYPDAHLFQMNGLCNTCHAR